MQNIKVGLFWGLVLMLALSGCLRLGTVTLPSEIKTIAIPVFKNRTFDYMAEEQVTSRIVQEFIKDGRLKVVASEAADVVLIGVITKYQITPQDYNSKGEPISFYLDLKIDAQLKKAQTDEVIIPWHTFQQNGSWFLENRPDQVRQVDIFSRMGEDMISYFLEGW